MALKNDIVAALRLRPGTKQVGAEIRFRCVYPEKHSNGDHNISAAYNEVSGFWNCKACGARGAAETLATALGIKVETEESVEATGCSLKQLAEAKGLKIETLTEHGCYEAEWKGKPCVRIPFYDIDGHLVDTKERVHVVAKAGSRWAKGKPLMPYGLERLPQAREAGYILLVEGESDVWTCHQYGIPVLGVPGSDTWRTEWVEYLEGIPEIYAWQESDKGGATFIKRIRQSIETVGIIEAPLEAKDPNELAKFGNFVERMAELRSSAKLIQPVSQQVMNSRFGDIVSSNDGIVEQRIVMGQEGEITLRAENVRKEHTGVHAKISIRLNDDILAYDTFNISRDGDRDRLAKSCKAACTADLIKRYLDLFCDGLEDVLAEAGMGTYVSGLDSIEAPDFPLKPYIIDGGGTILFAPPGRGKSYMAMLMAISIDAGLEAIWPVRQQRVLYINLERDGKEMQKRLTLCNKALGIAQQRKLLILNARGWSLNGVMESAKRTIDRYNVRVIFLDSISRAGMGKLVDDDAGNKIIDGLNRLSRTWLTLAHTPRGDETHEFGSVMFTAGADITIQLLSQEKGAKLGIGLQITKANDISKGQMGIYELEFSELGLIAAGSANMRDFPELSLGKKVSFAEEIEEHLLSHPTEDTPTQIATALSKQRSNVSRILTTGKQFKVKSKDGQNTHYGVKDDWS